MLPVTSSLVQNLTPVCITPCYTHYWLTKPDKAKFAAYNEYKYRVGEIIIRPPPEFVSLLTQRNE